MRHLYLNGKKHVISRERHGKVELVDQEGTVFLKDPSELADIEIHDSPPILIACFKPFPERPREFLTELRAKRIQYAKDSSIRKRRKKADEGEGGEPKPRKPRKARSANATGGSKRQRTPRADPTESVLAGISQSNPALAASLAAALAGMPSQVKRKRK